MRIKQIYVVVAVLIALLALEMRVVKAQATSQPPNSSAAIPLEMIGDAGGRNMPSSTASPQSWRTPGGIPSPYPTPQAPNYRPGINSAIKQLPNPFDGGKAPEHTHQYSVPSSSSQLPVYPTGQGLRQLVNPFDGGKAPEHTHQYFGPSSTAQSPVYPSGQGSSSYGVGGNKMLGRLRNPFSAWHAEESKGLLDYVGPGQAAGAGTAGAAAGATTPGAPGAATTPPADGSAGTGTPPAAGAAAADAATGPGYGGALEAAFTPFAMIGDLSPISIGALARTTNAGVAPNPPPHPTPGPPVPPGSRGASPPYAAARNVKISENQSPRPQDRIYFNFNYYNNLGNTINSRDLSPVTQMKAYTYLFGIEKTFNEGKGSIGFRVPLDTLTANSNQNVLSTPTSTAAGNLSIIGKYIIEENKKTGSLISAGLSLTVPSGTSRFAGAPYLFPLNSVYFQPYIGYIYNYNRWYLQGFSGFNFTSNVNDVSYMFNDIAVGYYLLRSEDPNAFLSAVAPTFELHVDTPINHRDVFSRFDLAGMPDVVDLTFGLNLQFRRAAVLTFAFVTPVASPKPFDSEAAVLLNIFYGRSRAGLIPITPPPAQ